MTLAPRTQVYIQLACNNVYGHDGYDHTALDPSPSSLLSTASHSTPAPFYSSLDPAGPHLDFHSLTSPSTLPVSPVQDRSQLDRPSDAYVILADTSRPDSNNTDTSSDDDEDETDPRLVPSKRCLTDPAVQAGAARIQTIMTTIMGALSALTTGWWGHFGEQHGRMRVLAASTLGLLLTCVPLFISAIIGNVIY